MRTADFTELDLNVSRGRVVLSLIAILSIYVDPATGGAFYLSRYSLITLSCHFLYSTSIYLAASRRIGLRYLPVVSTILDVSFAAAVVLVAEGPTSPSYVFFVFAIIAVNCRTGFGDTVAVTLCSGILYFLLLAFSAGGENHLYAMRAAYLMIIGYLIGFIGQQRARFEARIHDLETNAERHRIARALHDGYVQALAGVALRLEACRELLVRNRGGEAMTQLTELQTGVSREFDQVRAYVRSLAALDQRLGACLSRVPETRFRIDAAFAANGLIVEHAIQIMLEGLRNGMRHSNARNAVINARQDNGVIRITIEDDGVGFSAAAEPPWAIASRVEECGGSIRVAAGQNPGAHLEIEMPVG